MAEYWWIGYILMIIGWFLAGLYRKKSVRLQRKVVTLEENLEEMLDQENIKTFWFKVGYTQGVAFQKEAVRQSIVNNLKLNKNV